MGSGGGRGGDVLSSGAVHVTASLVKVLGFLLAEGMENVDHYKMVVLRERGPWEPAASRGRRGRNRGGASSIATMETYLCFWCQSASVCFSEIDKQVHSVILTSGEETIMGSRQKSWDDTNPGIKTTRNWGSKLIECSCVVSTGQFFYSACFRPLGESLYRAKALSSHDYFRFVKIQRYAGWCGPFYPGVINRQAVVVVHRLAPWLSFFRDPEPPRLLRGRAGHRFPSPARGASRYQRPKAVPRDFDWLLRRCEPGRKVKFATSALV